MLGKLFKHEFKNTGCILLPLNLILIGFTLLGMIMLGLNVFSNSYMGFAAVAMLVIYIFGIIALFIVTYVFLMVRFYRSMYSAEGYLTHTLPVSPLATLNTKLAVSAFWVFLSMVLCFGSVYALVATAIRTYTGEFNSADFFTGFEDALGISAGTALAWALLFMVLSSLSGILMIYCSISIGQLFNKYKILAAIVTYVIFYLILQVVNMIIMVRSSISSAEEIPLVDNADQSFLADFYGDVIGIPTMIQSVIMIVIFYAITAYISKKRVNLD